MLSVVRRLFIAGAVIASTYDLDRLLWVPGEKSIFIPAPLFTVAEIELVTTEAMRIWKRQLQIVTL